MNQSSTLARVPPAAGVSPESDSLLAAVRWLCEYHKLPASLEALYAGLPRGERLNPGLAARMLEQAGIGAGWVKRGASDLSDYLFPAVLLFKDGEARIVVGRKDGRYQLVVPEAGGGAVVMSEAELAKARNQKLAGFWRSLATISGKAQALGSYEVFHGDYRALFNAPAAFDAVDKTQLARVAAAVFRPGNRTVAVLQPVANESGE